MAKKGKGPGSEDDGPLDRIERALERWPAGLHDLGEPARHLPVDWPLPLVDVYMVWDGLRLFSEAIELLPAAEVRKEDDRWVIGSAWGDELSVDARGRVWRLEEDADEPVLDGTTPVRWLSGAIDAEAMLFAPDGEFAEDVFDEDGEIRPEIEIARLRARIKRDPRAPGPRWHLARRLARDEATLEEARDWLEEVVADEPGLAWAWLDLARISERLGELEGAVEEAVAAAEAGRGGEQEAFFWAHAARLAARRGDDARRAELATRATAADPRCVAGFVAGAEDNLAAGEPEGATLLVELARAVAPRDLAVLDLEKRLRS